MRILEYLYCRFYQLMVSVGNGDIAEFASIMLLTLVFAMNTLFIFSIFDILGRGTDISGTGALIYTGILAVILYAILVYNGRSSRIVERYEGESKKDRLKGRIIILAYMVFSIALMMSGFFIKMMQNRAKL